jgi:hypothetical protein
MKNTIVKSKLDQAKRQAKMFGTEEGSVGYRNILRQVFAKLIVGGRTIRKDMNTGKTYIIGKPAYQLGRRGKLI